MSKKNSHRPCPALQRGITSKECGGDRHSRIACTEDCPFNPFALQNYDELLEVEKSADAKARARLFKAMSPGRQSLFASQIRSMTGEVLEIEQAFRFEFFQRPGPDGRDFITTWDEEGWTGLNNDERTYYQGHRKLAPRLMEVHGPVDDGQVTVTDPRQPEQPPFPAMDRTLAATVPRFSILLAWQFPLPHYRRLFCANLPIQPLGPCSAVEVVDEIVRHRSGLSDPDQAARWLALHFNDFAKSYQATQEARLEDTRRLSDKRIFRTSWPYSGPMDEVLDRGNVSPGLLAASLTEAESMESEAAAYEIVAALTSLGEWTRYFGSTVIGRLLIAPGMVSAETVGQGNHERLMAIVAGSVGPLLKAGAIEIGPAPPLPAVGAPDPALVPPRLLEEPTIHEARKYRLPAFDPDHPRPTFQEIKDAMLKAVYRGFLDIPAPELNGLSLRAAAADPAHRPAVVRWMKKFINSIDLLEQSGGAHFDINAELAEMGLHELIFDPPANLREADDADETGDPDGGDEGDDDERPIMEELIESLTRDAGAFTSAEIAAFTTEPTKQPVLTEEEITTRQKRLGQETSDYRQVLTTTQNRWEPLFDALADFVGKHLTTEQNTFLTVHLVEVLTVMFPEGPTGSIQRRRLLHYLLEESKSFSALIREHRPESILPWVKRSPQPGICTLLAQRALTMLDDPEVRVRRSEAFSLLPLGKAVVHELSHQPKGR